MRMPRNKGFPWLYYRESKLLVPDLPLYIPSHLFRLSDLPASPIRTHWLSHRVFIHRKIYIFCFGCYCLVSPMFIALFGWLCWIFVSSKVKNSIPLTIRAYTHIFPTLVAMCISTAVDKIYIVQMREREFQSVKQASKQAKLSGKRNL